MKILGIESSCDDLAMCFYSPEEGVIAQKISSQVLVHQAFGGIFPEAASREHIRLISQVLRSLVKEVPHFEPEGIAVTSEPGLIGSLLVGLHFAKGLSLARGLPFYGVNHLEGHLMSPFLEKEKPNFPFLGLVISGGHTNLYLAQDWGKFELLGTTVDDAVGEAYDKVAKMLGLSYPGGPILDELAAFGNQKAFPFSIAKVKKGNFYSSFSGLKTAVLHSIQQDPTLSRIHLQTKEKNYIPGQSLEQIRNNQTALGLIASFQFCIIQSILRLFQKAFNQYQIKNWCISGGVACNKGLRNSLATLAQKNKAQLYFPRPSYCTDNAAMIALVGQYYLSQGKQSPLSCNAKAS